jgi:hypothetical protein
MKLKITVIVLSVLIVLAAGYVTSWMMFNADFQMEAPMLGDDGVRWWSILTPEHEAFANTARYGSILLLLLGIIMLAMSIFRKATLLQITLGALIGGLAVFIGRWGFPTDFVSAVPVEGERLLHVFTDSGPSQVFAQWFTVAVFLLSLAATAVSAVQFFKLKKKTIVQEVN